MLSANRNLLAAAAAAALVVAALVAASLFLRGGADESSAPAPTTTGEATGLYDGIPQERDVLGSPDATVTLIQFEDLQCPICKAYQEDGLPDIVREYVRPGKVKLRFVGMAFIGPDSEKALLHVIAAGEQGKLWQFADALYTNQGGENDGWVTDQLLRRVSGTLELNYAKLKIAADEPAVLRRANAMATEADELEVPGTPTFFVQVGDGEPYAANASSSDDLRSVLDEALAS